MKPIGEAQLKKQIASGEWMNTYVIFGEETYLKQFYVNRMIRKTVGDNEAFNFTRFGGNADMQAVYDAVVQMPFLSERRFVLLCDFDVEAARAEVVEQLYRVIEEQCSTTVFVIWFDTVAVDVKKAKKLGKLVEKCEKCGGVGVQLDRRSDAELVKTLTNAAMKRDCRLDSAAARFMLEVCGRDLQTLQNEIEKLCAYAPRAVLTRELIERVCVRTVDSSIYDLTAAIADRNGDKAMGLLGDLLFQKVEPISILSVMSGHYVDMYRAKAAEIHGVRPAAIAGDFGYGNRAFVLDKASRAAKKLSAQQLSRCLRILLEADAALKSTPSTDKEGYSRAMLEQVIVKLLMVAAEGYK